MHLDDKKFDFLNEKFWFCHIYVTLDKYILKYS